MRLLATQHPRFSTLCAITALACASLGAATGCSKRAEVAPTPEMRVSGTPGEVYERVLPELRVMMAENTKIVRVDEADGLVMRLSLHGRDDSVRLVEAVLRTGGQDATSVTVRSEQFRFLPGRSRDAVDGEVEAAVMRVFAGTERDG